LTIHRVFQQASAGGSALRESFSQRLRGTRHWRSTQAPFRSLRSLHRGHASSESTCSTCRRCALRSRRHSRYLVRATRDLSLRRLIPSTLRISCARFASSHERPNQSLEPTAGRRTEKRKDEL
jgi:hypothetical protein